MKGWVKCICITVLKRADARTGTIHPHTDSSPDYLSVFSLYSDPREAKDLAEWGEVAMIAYNVSGAETTDIRGGGDASQHDI